MEACIWPPSSFQAILSLRVHHFCNLAESHDVTSRVRGEVLEKPSIFILVLWETKIIVRMASSTQTPPRLLIQCEACGGDSTLSAVLAQLRGAVDGLEAERQESPQSEAMKGNTVPDSMGTREVGERISHEGIDES